MNLKESYRYANFLDGIIGASMRLLGDHSFLTTTEQKHLRNASNPNATDETLIVQKRTTLEASVMNVVDFTMIVLSEREDLHNAIAEAKKKMDLNMDAELSMNKCKHKFIENTSTLNTYFEIGRLIVLAQGGKSRAKYGDNLIKEWSIQ